MDGTGNLASDRPSASWARGADSGPGERRGSPRVRVLKKGKLILPNRMSVFECMIRDISETGARLSCENTSVLPGELQLMFHAVRELRHVRVVWRRPGELGVHFLGPASPAQRIHL